MPPSFAIAMAISVSDTVSIIAEDTGKESVRCLVNRETKTMFSWRTLDSWGISNTSSNVRPRGIDLITDPNGKKLYGIDCKTRCVVVQVYKLKIGRRAGFERLVSEQI